MMKATLRAVPMQVRHSSDDTTPSRAHEQPQLGRADLLPRAVALMRESVSGVPPRSYSGSRVPLHDSGKGLWTGHTVSRARLRGVGPQRHPTLALSPSRLRRGVSIIHRTPGLVSCPVMPPRRVIKLYWIPSSVMDRDAFDIFA